MVKLSQKKLQHKTINLPSYIISAYTLIPQISILIHFFEPATCIDREGLTLFLCLVSYLSRFLEPETREQQKYKKRIQTSVDNTAYDQLYEIKFENRVKNKKTTFFY